MSGGPIEFIGEVSRDEMPPTEYGGYAGLIQPDTVDGREAHSELTSSEIHGVVERAARVALPGSVQATGEDIWGGVVADPVSGRVLEGTNDTDDVSGTGGQFSDMKP